MSKENTLRRCSLALLLAAFVGCAGKPQPQVKIRYSEVPPEPPPQVVPAVPAAPAAEPVADSASLGAPISTREAMEKAVAWAVEGLTAYQNGQWEAARKSLNDARLILLEADLPDFWKEQGLAAIQSGLPENLRHLNLEAVAHEVEQADRPDAAELAERSAIETEARGILRHFGDNSPNQRDLDILVREIQRYVEFYRGKYRDFFERSFLLKHKYWPTIQGVLAAQKLPRELGYIAFVESGFNPKAVSRASALGLWQFIPETGRRYGLLQREDFYDVRKSTEAAAGYLKDLLSIFGSSSFLLATAAYNSGEGKIMGCLRQLDNPFETRSFWYIRSCLALETQEYVPKIMAAAVISSDPKRYGFDLPTEEQMRQRYDVVVVPQILPLARIAEMAGMDLVDLRLANNDLGASTFTLGRNFPLYLPAGSGAQLVAALSAMPVEPEVRVTSTMVPEIPRQRTYVVRGGDTLSSIARRYDLEVAALAKSNGIRSPYTLTIGQRLVLPGGGRAARARIVYTVRSGNTLADIADLFAVRDDDIMDWNDLRSRKVKAGQTLHIYPPREYELHTYKVRRGDNLAAIARRLGVTLDHLLTVNGLTSKKILRPGQRLVAYIPA